ncbi:Crotonase superfamily [Macleaya cordata]|uniref:Delta(3)-Delta(2)-enoyl-CoA isomerase n=1 Tax=Macleaya cordata TaxID=56857 RepID=A0A200R232_MACCD|nr:Crotonase superfamily [Macleaya cordata]
MCTLEKRGNLFLLTLTGHNEHRLNPTLIESIRTALEKVRTDAKPGSALITTAEGKFFSNGFDLAYAQAEGSPTGFHNRLLGMSNSFKQILADLISLPIPTVAAVSGHAAAAGFIFALSHDYVVMSKARGFLYMSELDIGLTFADYFMAWMKSKISSSRVRRDVLLQSMKIKAEKAVEMGIIDSAYDNQEETMKAALRLGEKLGSKKWNGEVYADIRKNTYSEISELLGLVKNYKSIVPARL